MSNREDDREVADVPPQKACFVICPIGEEHSSVRERSDELLEHIITPAARENGLTTIRADRISKPGLITTQIIQHILNDAVVVADLTDHRGNVFYELGLRHAFGKPVVQIIQEGQPVPFDVGGVRTVSYNLTLPGAHRAAGEIGRQIAAALNAGFPSDSPVAVAARLDELIKTAGPQTEKLLQAVLEQLNGLSNSVGELKKQIWKPTDFKDALPAMFHDRMDELFRRYEDEIQLLRYVRQAGVIAVYKRRESAVRAFSRYIDEESREIMVVGSSLKGLLQKEEYEDIAAKLKFKQQPGNVKVKYLLTHPIFADFRASQENRRPTEIGVEILKSLDTLRHWGTDPHNVRLYLGTPTCFAIKTSRQMLVNPYAYTSVSYDSPCLLLEEGGAGSPSYFFDEFSARHFGAWDTDLAVQIHDYDRTISQCSEALHEYARRVDELISAGKSVS